MHILFYGESPCVNTGLAQVSRTILDAILEEGSHTVEIVGTNHHMVIEYDKSVFPYTVVPVLDRDDPNVTKTVIDRIQHSQFDLFFMSTDFGRDVPVMQALINERQKGRQFLIVGYYAVDCDIIPPSTFDTLLYCNVKIVYSEHAKQVIARLRPDIPSHLINVFYLACEPDVFYPLSPEERRAARKEIFGIEDDSHFLCISVNRNQARKDLARLMAIFHMFHARHPNSTLYMHCKKEDLAGSLIGVSQSLEMSNVLPDKELIFTGENFHPLQGYSREWLNKLYNAADCLLSTSTGEGWGLSTTDAMAAECPVVVPHNTAFVEIVGTNEERGYLIQSGGDIDHRITLYGLTDNPRDIVWSESALEKLEEVYTDPEHARWKAKKARAWTLQYAKDKQTEKWKAFFADIGNAMQKLVTMEKAV